MDHDIVAKLLAEFKTIVTLIALGCGTVLATAILTTINTWASRRSAKTLGGKIDLGNRLTVDAQIDLSDKMDSAARSVKQDAMLAVKVAKTESNKVLEKIEDKLNGGPGGLNELTNRVVNLESRFDKFETTMQRILENTERKP